MKLYAKIKSEILDEIINGTKIYEYRQFESLTLTDENGRSETFQVGNIKTTKSYKETEIRKTFPGLFSEDLRIRQIRIIKD